MLPISQTAINPIIDLFIGINNHQTLPSQSDKGALGFLYINFAFLFLTTFVTILIYFYKRKDNEKNSKTKSKRRTFLGAASYIFFSFYIFWNNKTNN